MGDGAPRDFKRLAERQAKEIEFLKETLSATRELVGESRVIIDDTKRFIEASNMFGSTIIVSSPGEEGGSKLLGISPNLGSSPTAGGSNLEFNTPIYMQASPAFASAVESILSKSGRLNQLAATDIKGKKQMVETTDKSAQTAEFDPLPYYQSVTGVVIRSISQLLNSLLDKEGNSGGTGDGGSGIEDVSQVIKVVEKKLGMQRTLLNSEIQTSLGDLDQVINGLIEQLVESEAPSKDTGNGKPELDMVTVRNSVSGIRDIIKQTLSGFQDGETPKVAERLFTGFVEELKESLSGLEKVVSNLDNNIKTAADVGVDPLGPPNRAIADSFMRLHNIVLGEQSYIQLLCSRVFNSRTPMTARGGPSDNEQLKKCFDEFLLFLKTLNGARGPNSAFAQTSTSAIIAKVSEVYDQMFSSASDLASKAQRVKDLETRLQAKTEEAEALSAELSKRLTQSKVEAITSESDTVIESQLSLIASLRSRISELEQSLEMAKAVANTTPQPQTQAQIQIQPQQPSPLSSNQTSPCLETREFSQQTNFIPESSREVFERHQEITERAQLEVTLMKEKLMEIPKLNSKLQKYQKCLNSVYLLTLPTSVQQSQPQSQQQQQQMIHSFPMKNGRIDFQTININRFCEEILRMIKELVQAFSAPSQPPTPPQTSLSPNVHVFQFANASAPGQSVPREKRESILTSITEATPFEFSEISDGTKRRARVDVRGVEEEQSKPFFFDFAGNSSVAEVVVPRFEAKKNPLGDASLAAEISPPSVDTNTSRGAVPLSASGQSNTSQDTIAGSLQRQYKQSDNRTPNLALADVAVGGHPRELSPSPTVDDLLLKYSRAYNTSGATTNIRRVAKVHESVTSLVLKGDNHSSNVNVPYVSPVIVSPPSAIPAGHLLDPSPVVRSTINKEQNNQKDNKEVNVSNVLDLITNQLRDVDLHIAIIGKDKRTTGGNLTAETNTVVNNNNNNNISGNPTDAKGEERDIAAVITNIFTNAQGSTNSPSHLSSIRSSYSSEGQLDTDALKTTSQAIEERKDKLNKGRGEGREFLQPQRTAGDPSMVANKLAQLYTQAGLGDNSSDAVQKSSSLVDGGERRRVGGVELKADEVNEAETDGYEDSESGETDYGQEEEQEDEGNGLYEEGGEEYRGGDGYRGTPLLSNEEFKHFGVRPIAQSTPLYGGSLSPFFNNDSSRTALSVFRGAVASLNLLGVFFLREVRIKKRQERQRASEERMRSTPTRAAGRREMREEFRKEQGEREGREPYDRGRDRRRDGRTTDGERERQKGDVGNADGLRYETGRRGTPAVRGQRPTPSNNTRGADWNGARGKQIEIKDEKTRLYYDVNRASIDEIRKRYNLGGGTPIDVGRGRGERDMETPTNMYGAKYVRPVGGMGRTPMYDNRNPMLGQIISPEFANFLNSKGTHITRNPLSLMDNSRITYSGI